MSREKQIVKSLKKALKYEYLYSPEELIKMKKELANLEKNLELLRKITNKGFGKYETN